MVWMVTVADQGRKEGKEPVSNLQIQPWRVMEQSNLSRQTFLAANGDRETSLRKLTFPVQSTARKIGNYNRSVRNPLNALTTQTRERNVFSFVDRVYWHMYQIGLAPPFDSRNSGKKYTIIAQYITKYLRCVKEYLPAVDVASAQVRLLSSIAVQYVRFGFVICGYLVDHGTNTILDCYDSRLTM